MPGRKIYYTGIGANKSGVHTPDEFVKIMNEHFDIDCATRLTKHKIPSCKKHSQLVKSTLETMMKKSQKKPSKMTKTKLHQLSKNCDKQVQKKLKNSNNKCNLEDYLEYSGAEKKDF